MRIIPGNTKVQVEIFKGVTLWDLLVGALAAIMLALIVVSTFPYKIVLIVVHAFISILLLLRIDKEPTYMYLIHILRHFGFGRRFNNLNSDESLFENKNRSEKEVAFDEIFNETPLEVDEIEEDDEIVETKAERKARLKREKEEYKQDTKLLKSKKLSKEEEDAIWLKRANQAKYNKEAKTAAKNKEARTKQHKWEDISEVTAFTGISDGFIEYGRRYFGAVIEVSSVEFRFFSDFRRANSIENCFGAILRSIRPDYSANIIKIERPISFDNHLNTEYKKLDELKKSYIEGFVNDEELKARVAVIYDRIYDLINLRDKTRVVNPFYYIVLFDADKKQLNIAVDSAIDTLKAGEIEGRRLDDKELAVFLKYTNELDFNEDDVEKLRPEDYVKWAMPKKLEFTPRTTIINGMVTHNFRVVSFPTAVNDAWLASLMTYPSTKVVVKARPMDSGKAIAAIDKSLAELRGVAQTARTDSAALDAQTHIQTLQHLLSSLHGDNESLLNVNVYITAYDPQLTNENPKISDLKYETLRAKFSNMKKVIKNAWSESGFKLNGNEFSQAMAYIGSQVSGYDPMEKNGRGIPSNTVAACYPWVFPFIMDENGVKLGTSEGVPVFLDFFKRDAERVNSNMVILGKSGSGKSYATKALLANLAADDAKIFILDPEDEYSDLARNLNGKFINVANAQYGRLNPFHIITTLDDDETEENEENISYATHLQFLEEFFKQILPDCDRDSLEYLNALLDRVYAQKGITPYTDLSKLRPEDYPIFDDLYDEILKEFQRVDSDYVRSMLRTLMNYISKFSDGGRNAVIWNGPSSITTEENFTVFNFQSLLANRNTTVANAQMLLVLKYIDNEIIKNRDYNEKYGLNRKIVVVIDEAHVFIDTKFPVALDFMFQLAKRIRKYNGMQIVITQNIKDFVGSEEIARKSTAIINACQYSFIFSLSPNDMADLCTLYEKAGGINENEQEQIVQAKRGQAFVVMTPTSRTNINITVPADVEDLFSNPAYVNQYFDKVGGEENWAEYLGDAAEKRAEALEKHDVVESVATVIEDVQRVEVNYEELSKDEYDEQYAEDIKETIPVAEPVIEPVAEPIAEPIAEPEPSVDDTLAAATKVIIPAPVEVKEESSKVEEILSELVVKLGIQSMEDRIRLVVQEELAKNASNTFAPAVAPAVAKDQAEETVPGEFDYASLAMGAPDDNASDEETSDNEDEKGGSKSLGSIFDFASLANIDDIDEQEEDDIELDLQGLAGDDEDAEEETGNSDDGDDFDLMKFLARQAAAVDADEEDDDFSVAEFLDSNGLETVLDVTLEQLISYNKKAK